MKNFTLTKDHIKLIRKMWVSWDDCEYGAPQIDPKRPYGNSDVVTDIYEILTGKELDDDKVLTETVCEKYDKLHSETETALQIILSTGKFKPGNYVSSDYNNDWKLVSNKKTQKKGK